MSFTNTYTYSTLRSAKNTRLPDAVQGTHQHASARTGVTKPSLDTYLQGTQLPLQSTHTLIGLTAGREQLKIQAIQPREVGDLDARDKKMGARWAR
jgi:hypothetical protein